MQLNSWATEQRNIQAKEEEEKARDRHQHHHHGYHGWPVGRLFGGSRLGAAACTPDQRYAGRCLPAEAPIVLATLGSGGRFLA